MEVGYNKEMFRIEVDKFKEFSENQVKSYEHLVRGSEEEQNEEIFGEE